MTAPPRICPICGWTNSHAPSCGYHVPPPNSDARALSASYVDLRRDCIAVEELIEHNAGHLSADDLKRLDKAVTLMKVGFKLVKKVLRAQGITETKSWRDTTEPVTPNVEIEAPLTAPRR